MKITEKLKSVMSLEDLNELETAIQTMVNEEVAAKVALLTEEKTRELTTKAEQYVVEAVEERVAKIVKKYDAKMEQLESTLVENLDAFLASEVQTQISDAVITKVAINECLVPIVDGIRSVFSENFVELDSNGDKKIRELTEKVEELTTQTSTLIAEKMELASKVEKRRVTDLIATKVAGLKAEHVARVSKMFESETYDNVAAKIDGFVSILVESENKPVAKPIKKVVETAAPQIPRKPLNEQEIDGDLATAAHLMA